jgi:transcriptional regulator with XRE-family HTH domain
MTFGAFIRSKRKATGRTQTRLANEAGITPPYICQIENEQAPAPSEGIVRRLAQALLIDETELINLANESRPPKQARKEPKVRGRDPEPTRLKKQANLERARAIYAQMRREGIA